MSKIFHILRNQNERKESFFLTARLTRSIVTIRSKVSFPFFFPFLPLFFDLLTCPLAKAPLSSALPEADLGRGYGGPPPGLI